MCMNISKEDLIKINAKFGGSLRNSLSIDFAISAQKNKRMGSYKKLAYLVRAILVDHPFSDGNKRTAAFIIINFAKDNNKTINKELLEHYIISIAKQNISNIRNIEWRIKNAIK